MTFVGWDIRYACSVQCFAMNDVSKSIVLSAPELQRIALIRAIAFVANRWRTNIMIQAPERTAQGQGERLVWVSVRANPGSAFTGA